MRNITFLEDERVQRDGATFLYRKGETYAFSDPTADRYVRRGKAELADEDAALSEPRQVDAAGRPETSGPEADVAAAELAAQEAVAHESVARNEAKAAVRDRRQAEAGLEEARLRAERSSVDIPSEWRELSWPALRKLAGQLSDETIENKEQAVEAVEAELTRRSG